MPEAERTSNPDQCTKDFSVNVFLGKDRMIRFVPGVRNRFGIYVPLPEGLEVPLCSGPKAIGTAYLQTAGRAVSHFGEDLDMRTAKPKYTSFKHFRSQKQFNLNHACFSSFGIGGTIKFTFLPWHKNEFCLLKSDKECILEIAQTNDALVVGSAVLDIVKMADGAYPELNLLSLETERLSVDGKNLT